jgi:hypothetical protein
MVDAIDSAGRAGRAPVLAGPLINAAKSIAAARQAN